MDVVCGGFSQIQDAIPDIQDICVQVKSDVELFTNKKYAKFTAVKYRSQVVAGRNYLIKVYLGGVDYIHLCVFQDLRCNGGGVHLMGLQEHKTKDNPLEPFELKRLAAIVPISKSSAS